MPRDARDGRDAVRVLALQREHEGIDGDRRWVWPPRHEVVERTVALGRKEVYRVWAVPSVNKIEDLHGQPDVGVILLLAT